jgi:hypothetical protein
MCTLWRRRMAMCPSAVARCVLPTPTGGEQQRAVGAVEEAQAGELGPVLLVVAHRRGGVPGVEAHARVQAGGPGAQRRGVGLAAGDLIGENELEEVGVRQMLLLGQDEPLGQGVGQLAELQGAQDRA